MSQTINDIRIKTITDCFNTLPTRTHNPNLVEYAETTIIPSGPYRGLKYSTKRGPYLREIMELLSPDSQYREIVMMFPAQSGKTFTANTATMYYIEAVPSEIIYATSDESAAVKWLEREIVPRAESAGVVFRSEVEAKQSRKTGNTMYSKIFTGGNIDIASANSPAQLASATKRFAQGDEVDRWKTQLGVQGSPINQLRARTQAWGDVGKILWFSTPTTEDESVIYQLFLQGDQRLYYVPCPFCGTFQLLGFMENRGYGLTWENKDGRIYKKSIELICENKNCGRGIKETSKRKMLIGGEWRPSALAEYEYIASFHINGLYSFQLSWFDMIVGYEESKKGPIKKQDFDMLKMGWPHRLTGTRPKVQKIIDNKGNYNSGEVPEGVLFLTIGMDVQKGSESDKNNPARIELEVLGIGAGYKTWSIEYNRFEGSIDDPFSGAWEDLHQYATKTGLQYYRNDGFCFPVSLVFIDSGIMPDIIYSFCERWGNTFPIKGRATVKKSKKQVSEQDGEFAGDFLPYRMSKIDNDIILYLINTNYYKSHIYNNLKIPRQETYPQRPGFCEFPRDYPDFYFEMLTSEERRRDGSFHNPTGRKNESLDCRVYALCAGDVFLYSEVLNYRAWAKKEGWHPQDIQKINKRYVLETMAKQTKKNVKKL